MKRSQPFSESSTLSPSFHHRLNLYALAATAAGVGVLALAQPAAAKIIYKRIHKQMGPHHVLPLDLNGDGQVDFKLNDKFSCTSFCEYMEGSITIVPTRQANEIVGHAGHSFHSASALAHGVRIGPRSPFSAGEKALAWGGYDAGTQGPGYCGGPWVNATDRYLGLRFTIAGKIHYGWARLNETCNSTNGENSAVLTGYAFESEPNRRIIAGDTKGPTAAPPTTLGKLALGAALSVRAE